MQRLHSLVDEIDDADSTAERDARVREFVETVSSANDAVLELWLDAEEQEITALAAQAPAARHGQLAPAAALLRVQAVTKALGLAANSVQKGVRKVRNLLNKWIGRMQTWLVGTVKQSTGATAVSLEVELGPVSIGLSW
ncbi:hypothetical protein E1218_19735 [Kribbella turkmenica]|uniref:Uncharacterized protein n=1 Tax=Kribbella turkmenica TaxID=2530375 RepID=A0A4R4WWV0_9ACTN|nr:hypothetical protein [Kribbella turkmenica]TDD22188.1 hypothetical protein E1218_19735 [Kribbella turkmenica]